MRMIFAFIHFEPEKLGLMAPVLDEFELKYKEVLIFNNETIPSQEEIEGLIVMGGPMGVNEESKFPFLIQELKCIQETIRLGKPVLGICLGAQLVAKALGSKVYSNGIKELGWKSIQLTPQAKGDLLFGEMPQELTVFHWHGDTFDLPKGAIRLAQSASCLNQAFRFKNNVYGFQFHIEFLPDMVRALVTSRLGQADLDSAGENGQLIMSESDLAVEKLKPTASHVFKKYFQRAYIPRQPHYS